MTNTTLINKENKIKNSFYKRVELIDAKDINNNDIQVEKNTYEAFLKLQNALAKENIIIGIDSAYRSEEHQLRLYNEFIEKYGKEYADKIATKQYCIHNGGT